jgi:hypothetical protein
MNYIDKIEKLRKIHPQEIHDNKVYRLEIPKKGLTKSFLARIKFIYPWLPSDYLDFLSRYNGLILHDVLFLGDEKAAGGNLKEQSFVVEKKGPHERIKIPIAIMSLTEVYMLDEKGRVTWRLEETIEKFVSKSFSSFIDEFCLGRKYLNFYGGNAWSSFLKKKGII